MKKVGLELAKELLAQGQAAEFADGVEGDPK